jgi:hypothetical protein
MLLLAELIYNITSTTEISHKEFQDAEFADKFYFVLKRYNNYKPAVISVLMKITYSLLEVKSLRSVFLNSGISLGMVQILKDKVYFLFLKKKLKILIKTIYLFVYRNI